MQRLQDICGSGNNVGVTTVVDEVLKSDSIADGSVVERGVLGDSAGGVPLLAGRGCLAPVRSVVRRELGGVGKAGNAEVGGGEVRGGIEVLPDGLSDIGRLKAALLGELGLEDVYA